MIIKYRPEIDGMRAIAVLSVVIYHLKLSFGAGHLLPGGFLGVDMFFVISGFLITKIILGELDAEGRFSLRNFYWRRARRILPPLILVIVASLPAAWLFLVPNDLERFANSLIAAIFFYSNFFWFLTQGNYGAQSALLQPFLHTWSLAIEEQFYLVFPLFFVVIARGRWVGLVIGALTLAAFIVAELTSLWREDLSFFSPVSRAWELLSGSYLAWMSNRHPKVLRGRALLRVLPAAGLILVMASIWTINLHAVVHPGLVTIPVVLGTCAMIWFANANDLVTRLLSTPCFVGIGKLSYSIYLWHYPIFAFGRQVSLEPAAIDMAVWLLLTFLLSAAGYVLVEKPFRYSVGPRPFFGILAFLTAFVVGLGAATGFKEGFPSRFGALATVYAENEFDNEKLKEVSFALLDGLSPDEKIGNWNAQSSSSHERENLWFSDPAKKNVLIVGNSHSKDIFNALYLQRQHFPDMEFARFGIASELPEGQRQLFLRLQTSRTPMLSCSQADIALIFLTKLPTSSVTFRSTESQLQCSAIPRSSDWLDICRPSTGTSESRPRIRI